MRLLGHAEPQGKRSSLEKLKRNLLLMRIHARGKRQSTHDRDNRLATLLDVERIRNIQFPRFILHQQERLVWPLGRFAFLCRECDLQGIGGAQCHCTGQFRRGCESVFGYFV